MLDNLLFSLNAVLPIIFLVTIGYLLKRSAFLKEEFYKGANKFVFYIALPCLLFKNLYDSEITNINYKLLIFIALSITALFILSIVFTVFLTKDQAKRGVLIQGICRSNYAFIGIPLAQSMFTTTELINKATMTASIASLVCIPLFNTYSVIVLSIFNNEKLTEKKELIKKTIFKIITNPLIIAIFIGLLVLVFRYFVPSSLYIMKNNLSFLYKVIKYLSEISTPLALIVVGGEFCFKEAKRDKVLIIIQTVTKTVVVPAIFIMIASFLGFMNYEIAVLVSVFASPVAIASAIMAKEMNSDNTLASSMVLFSTLASSITLFLIIFILKTIGVL